MNHDMQPASKLQYGASSELTNSSLVLLILSCGFSAFSLSSNHFMVLRRNSSRHFLIFSSFWTTTFIKCLSIPIYFLYRC